MNNIERYKLLIVDDEPANLNLLRQILKAEYHLTFAKSGPDALANIKKRRPDMILLDVMMPNLNGYQVCQLLKDDPATADIPVIFCTALNDDMDEITAFKTGAVDFITKPVRAPVVLERVATHLALSDQQRAVKREIKLAHKDLMQSRLSALRMLGRAAEFRDNETGYHVVRMSEYAYLLAQELGWPESECDLIRTAAPMHDVGKIGIPDDVLLKPGKLDADEWKIMKTHAEIGARIIGDSMDDSELFKQASIIAESHHEKWNGTGYPKGISGTAIPAVARVVAITDVFDALTSERPYKAAWSIEKAIDLIKEERGKHFDPEMVDAFVAILPRVIEVRKQFLD